MSSTKPFTLEPWDVMLDRERGKVDVLLTPSCAELCLRTPRMLLRPVRFGDSIGIKKIKTEPIVQKTQLYGTPRSIQEIKANFQTRYIASNIPAISREEYTPDGEVAEGGAWRDEFIWAITVKPGKTGEVKILPAGEVRLQNRLTNLDGYVGEIYQDGEEGSRRVRVADESRKYRPQLVLETTIAATEGRSVATSDRRRGKGGSARGQDVLRTASATLGTGDYLGGLPRGDSLCFRRGAVQQGIG